MHLSSMAEPQRLLGTVVQVPLDIGFRQAQPFDMVRVQHRIVAAGRQMVGAKGFEGAGERRLRTPTYSREFSPPKRARNRRPKED
jgi:hypothetical protein